jgi:hypothetical protein
MSLDEIGPNASSKNCRTGTFVMVRPSGEG